MQASIADEIGRRLTLYARFGALVPDRLRLAVAESIAKSHIPVLLDTGLVEECAELLPNGQSRPVPADFEVDLNLLRRAIRLAQIHANLDVLGIARWLSERGDKLLKLCGRLYLKGLREIGQGEGGEETAYLVGLLILHAFREALQKKGKDGSPEQQALVNALLGMALEGALASEAGAGEALSARLGFQFAVTSSPFALGARVSRLIESPLNSYRTTSEALELMKAQLKGPEEKLDLDQCVSRVAEQLLGRALPRTRLAQEVLHELVRDCMLLGVMKLHQRQPTPLLKVFHRLASSGTLLAQHVTDPTRRGQLIHAIDLQPSAAEQPLPTLRKLLVEADRPLLGATRPLRGHGDVGKRAELAAAGAMLLLLDQKVSQYVAELMSRVQFVSAGSYPEGTVAGRALMVLAEPARAAPRRSRARHSRSGPAGH